MGIVHMLFVLCMMPSYQWLLYDELLLFAFVLYWVCVCHLLCYSFFSSSPFAPFSLSTLNISMHSPPQLLFVLSDSCKCIVLFEQTQPQQFTLFPFSNILKGKQIYLLYQIHMRFGTHHLKTKRNIFIHSFSVCMYPRYALIYFWSMGHFASLWFYCLSLSPKIWCLTSTKSPGWSGSLAEK